MLVTWEVTLPALTGKEKRMAYVYLPKNYATDTEKTYPVLYMFDGHNVFYDTHATYGKSWGIRDYLDRFGDEIIVASVECNHHPDHGRLKEYTPYPFTFPDGTEITAKGDLTMKWLTKTFMPYVEKHFRVKKGRDHTWIAGSSMGGLMSLYALLAYNSKFGRAAALSPSIWVDISSLNELIDNTKIRKNTVLYMDYGECEFGNHTGMRKDFAAMGMKLMEKGVLVTSRVVPGGHHCEASWEKQIPFFLRALEYDVIGENK